MADANAIIKRVINKLDDDIKTMVIDENNLSVIVAASIIAEAILNSTNLND